MSDWMPLESSNVAAMRYDAQDESLFVKFKSGATYAYAGVPQEDADGLQSAPSPGKYMREHIIGSYEHRRV